MNESLKLDAAGRLLADVDAGDNAQPFSVSELSNALKRTVEDQFGHVRVRGELTGYKRAASGHLYFGLKDENAMIDGVMWKGSAIRLPFAPEDGLEVIATGKLTTYPGRSKYQIVAESLELAGEGALMLLFEKLKQRLAAEGLFDNDRKRAIPRLPRTIGVVTSPTGAVIQDILHRLNDRFPCHVIVWPVLVQGENAAAQVSAAINGFSNLPDDGAVTRPDVIIVARGGGSIEDLWAFNEEAVVRAVASSTIPVISAVGHETDTTLCDYGADLRAPTPTAAAEMAVPVRSELLDRVAQNMVRLDRAARRGLNHAAERLEAQRRLLPKLSDIAAPQQQRADELGERLSRGLERRVSIASLAFAAPSGALNHRLLMRLADGKNQRLAAARLPVPALRQRIANDQMRLDSIVRLLGSLHPESPLSRGFARITDASGKTLMSVDAAKNAGHAVLRFADGSIGATIDGSQVPVVMQPKTKPIATGESAPQSSPKKAVSTGQGNLFGE
jgi:exodeoxyribonuclease VII large subunit